MPGFALLQRLLQRILFTPRAEADAEAQQVFGAEPTPPTADWKVMVVFVTSAISLTLLEYFGMSNRYPDTVAVLDAIGLNSLACRLDGALDITGMPRYCADAAEWVEVLRPDGPHNSAINRLTYWAVACFTVYFIIPALVIKLVLRERILDYGLRMKGALKDWWIYALMFGVVAPLVLFVSTQPHFQETYPFYEMGPHEPLWPNFWRWELLYFSQFFALEFFFRGFMIHGTRHRLGFYAVFAMMVPYCMIHFGKPMPETFGAIIAGVFLGSLSLKARSIWLGVAIHASVALSMDFASLWQQGYF